MIQTNRLSQRLGLKRLRIDELVDKGKCMIVYADGSICVETALSDVFAQGVRQLAGDDTRRGNLLAPKDETPKGDSLFGSLGNSYRGTAIENDHLAPPSSVVSDPLSHMLTKWSLRSSRHSLTTSAELGMSFGKCRLSRTTSS